MTEVFDINKLPERRLRARHLMALHDFPTHDEAIMDFKRHMAMRLAMKIIDSEPFFKQRPDVMCGVEMIEIGVDCIVLTSDELATIKRESFGDGIRHMQGFMSLSAGRDE